MTRLFVSLMLLTTACTGATSGTGGASGTGGTSATGGTGGTGGVSCADPEPPNLQQDGSTALALDEVFDGTFCTGGFQDEDTFTIATNPQTLITAIITTDVEAGTGGLVVMDRVRSYPESSGVLRATFQADASSTDMRVLGFADGDYSLVVHAGCFVDAACSAGQWCDRRLATCVVDAEPACGNDASSPNHSDSRALVLDTSAPVSLAGLALCDEDRDMFLLSIPDGATLDWTVTSATPGSLNVYLLDTAGVFFVVQSSSAEQRQATAPHLPAGDYTLLITSLGQPADYDLAVEVDPTPCTSSLDCGVQSGRTHCLSGACAELVLADRSVPVGGACSDSQQCAVGQSCDTDANNPDRWICAPNCGVDGDCTGVAVDAYCLGRDPCSGSPRCALPCSSNADCGLGESCQGGRCGACFANGDCPGGSCINGACDGVCQD